MVALLFLRRIRASTASQTLGSPDSINRQTPAMTGVFKHFCLKAPTNTRLCCLLLCYFARRCVLKNAIVRPHASSAAALS